jgi:hypothetical protein
MSEIDPDKFEKFRKTGITRARVLTESDYQKKME